MNYPQKYEYKYFQRESVQNSCSLFQKPFLHQVAGEIMLGYLFGTRTIFSVFKDELVQHMCIMGRSGAGKTNIMRIILIVLANTVRLRK